MMISFTEEINGCHIAEMYHRQGDEDLARHCAEAQY